MEHVFGSHMLSSGMKITSTSGVKVVKKATKNGGGVECQIKVKKIIKLTKTKIYFYIMKK